MPAAEKPFMRFTHSKALRNRTLKVLDAIDEEDDPTEYCEDLAEIIVELNEAGIKFFFMDPLHKLKMGSAIERTADFGIYGTLRIMGPAVRTIVGRMDKRQLRKVSKIMRGMMD